VYKAKVKAVGTNARFAKNKQEVMGERNSGRKVCHHRQHLNTYMHRSIQLKTGPHAIVIPCFRSWLWLASFKSDMMERLLAMESHIKKKGFWNQVNWADQGFFLKKMTFLILTDNDIRAKSASPSTKMLQLVKTDLLDPS
jgi:hypothetical protein